MILFLSSFKRRVLLPAAALLLGLLLVEVALFVLDPYLSRQGFYSFDPEMGFRVNSGALHGRDRANQFGFNDRDHQLGEHPGIYRVLILGDSFNWMGGPLCNYTRILERDLVERFGEDRVEIINAGYSGTHTAQQLEALRKFGMQYHPNLVVLGFFAGNDFADGSPHKIRVGWMGTTTDVDTRRDFYAVLWGRPLVWRSRLFSLLQDRYLQWRASRGPQYPLPRLETRVEIRQFCQQVDDATPPQIPEQTYLRIAGTRMELGYRNRAPDWEENETYILNALDEMGQLVRERGADFMVVAYPAEFQVDPVFRNQVVSAAGREPGDYVDAYAQNLLREHCLDTDCEFHDLLPAFREAQAQGQKLYLPLNTHWNWAGNQLAARFLLEWIAPRIQDFEKRLRSSAVQKGN